MQTLSSTRRSPSLGTGLRGWAEVVLVSAVGCHGRFPEDDGTLLQDDDPETVNYTQLGEKGDAVVLKRRGNAGDGRAAMSCEPHLLSAQPAGLPSMPNAKSRIWDQMRLLKGRKADRKIRRNPCISGGAERAWTRHLFGRDHRVPGYT